MTHWRKHQGLALHFTCEKREFFRSNILFLYEYFNENKFFDIKFHSEIHWPQLKCGIVLPFLEVKIMNKLVKMHMQIPIRMGAYCQYIECGYAPYIHVTTSLVVIRYFFFSFSFSQSICFSAQCAHAYGRDSMPGRLDMNKWLLSCKQPILSSSNDHKATKICNKSLTVAPHKKKMPHFPPAKFHATFN